MEGRWHRQNPEPDLVRTRTVLWQLASDGMGRRSLVSILLSLWHSLPSGDGYGWVLFRGCFSYKFGAIFFIAELAGQ